MAAKKIQATKDYTLFHRHEGENRKLDIKKHKKLLDSMKLYGFLSCFPIVCVRDTDGKLVIKDGQHRFAIAQSLGLAIYWVEESVDFDVAVVNSTSKIWVLRDYAEKHAANGHKAYHDGLDFANAHGLPIGTAFALLAGTTGFANIQDQFLDGTYRVRDRKWADDVASVYGPMVALAPVMKNARFVEACMAACRVPTFDGKRLVQNAERCRDKLGSYSTRDAYLEMLEEVYNFGRMKLLGLKAEAMMAMRERSAAKKKPATPVNGQQGSAA